MSTVQISSFSPQINWPWAGSTATLRYTYSADFEDSTGAPVLHGLYKDVPCTVIAGVLTVSSHTIISTLDALVNPLVTLSAQFIDASGAPRSWLFQNSAIPTTTPTTIGALMIYAQGSGLVQPPDWYLTAIQTQNLINTALGTLADASDVVKGRTKLSIAPVSASNPIAAGDNDPRMGSYLNILTYGAVGDDSSDNAAALTLAQAAAIAAGKGLYIPVGTFRVVGGFGFTAPVVFAPGASILKHAGGSLSFTKAITADISQHFASTSTIVVSFAGNTSIATLYSEWWGTGAPALAAMTTARVTQETTSAVAYTGGLDIQPKWNTTSQALNIEQHADGVLNGTTQALNTLAIYDAVDGGGSFIDGLRIIHTFGGGATAGGREAFISIASLAGPLNASTTNDNFVGMVGWGRALASAGGGLGSEIGRINGGSWIGTLAAGATHMAGLAGGEINVEATAGSSVLSKSLLSLASSPGDVVQGSVSDIMFSMSNQTGAIGWQNGILIGDQNGVCPITTTGTLFATRGTATVATGIDISSWNFNGNAFKSTSFIVKGTGKVTVGGPSDPNGPLLVIGASQAFTTALGAGQGLLRLSTGTGTATDNSLTFGIHNSDYAWIQAAQAGTATRELRLNYDGGDVALGGVLRTGSLTFAALGTPVNGTVVYCIDAKNVATDGAAAGSVAAGSGTGTFVWRINGAWRIFY